MEAAVAAVLDNDVTRLHACVSAIGSGGGELTPFLLPQIAAGAPGLSHRSTATGLLSPFTAFPCLCRSIYLSSFLCFSIHLSWAFFYSDSVLLFVYFHPLVCFPRRSRWARPWPTTRERFYDIFGSRAPLSTPASSRFAMNYKLQDGAEERTIIKETESEIEREGIKTGHLRECLIYLAWTSCSFQIFNLFAIQR